MKRMLLALLLVGCQARVPIEVETHCGLDDARVQYDDRMWRFEVEEQSGPPAGWRDPRDTMYVLSVEGDTLVAIGPDRKQWSLAVTDQAPERLCF